MKFGVSQSVPRLEDDALVRGHGRYVADYAPDGLLHAYVLRSPHAHARVSIGDTSQARSMPGVRLILTGSDTAGLRDMPCQGIPPGVQLTPPPYPVLVRDTVRHVGDAVAFVVADTLDQAKDAAESIPVRFEPLAHVVDATAALKPGAPLVRPEFPGNLAFEHTQGDKAAVERAFAAAAHTVSLTIVNQRLVTNYLDTRAVVAEYDADSGRITLTLGSQGSHRIRDIVAKIIDHPADRMRVVTPDVGGGFGTKLFPFREYPLAAFAAARLERPLAWIADRSEHFLADAQGRDNVTTGRLAFDGKGKILALDVDTVANLGAYLSLFGPFVAVVGTGMLPGLYDIPACFIRVRAAFTNTLPVDAYRGAGRPEAAYVIERLMDAAARDLGMAPDALRRRNFVKPSAMPYRTATGRTYDSGEFEGHMARALDIGDWAGFKARQAASRKAKRLRGIGFASYIEACGTLGPETARVSLDEDGGVTVRVGTQSTGQGHRTAYAQLVSEQLGLPAHMVRMRQGDTDDIPTGVGTGGSSSIPSAGHSVRGATQRLTEQLKSLAADALEASAGDIEVADGEGAMRVAGTDRSVSFAELAARASGQADVLSASDAFAPKSPTYPNGTHLAEVEIDPETGQADIVSYVIVDDFGMTLNPLLLEGQVVGGAVQGIGQAMMENTVYDSVSGQLLTASLMDYALPRGSTTPAFRFETRNVPCRVNPMGVKGAGEAGTVGAAPAVMNAVLDALWRAHRVRDLDMPATPARIWEAIAEAKRRHTL